MALALAACAGDPAEYGITGPFPGGAPPVTLKRPDQKPERSDDTLGGEDSAETRHAPPALTSANGPRDRYYGYKR